MTDEVTLVPVGRYLALHWLMVSAAKRITGRASVLWINLVALIISSTPFLILGFVLATGHKPYCPLLNLVWAVDYAALNYVLLMGSFYSWTKLLASFEAIDDLTSTATVADRRRLRAWWQSCVGLRAQVLGIVSGLSGAVVGAFLLVTFSHGFVHRTLLTDITAIVTGIIAGHSAHCVIAGVMVAHKTARIPNLKIVWNAPVNTPGLLTLSDTARITAQLGLLCFILAEAPITYVEAADATLVITILYVSALFTAGGFVLVVGVGAQAALSRRVRDEKIKVLEPLASRLEQIRWEYERQRWEVQRIRYLMTLQATTGIYRAIDSSASSYLNANNVAQYVASMAAVGLQFVVPLITHR
jgi:hypothetical protein